MSKISLEKASQRPYGQRQHGQVEFGLANKPHKIDITYRKTNDDRDKPLYILATGWIGKRDSMRLVAHQLAKAGFNSIAFNYSNIGTKQAINHNKDDLLAIIDSQEQNQKLRLIGLSMGGLVTAKAVKEVGARVDSATLVASAGFMNDGLDYILGAEGLLSTWAEVINMWRFNPSQAMHLGASSVSHCLKRSPAILSEMVELMGTGEQHLIKEIKANKNAPKLNFLYALKDRILPARQQQEGISGLPFDKVEGYNGGHLDLVVYPWLTDHIIELENDKAKLSLAQAA